MTLRPGRTMRTLERPWTRTSKRMPRKSYVKGVPVSKIHQFNSGTPGNYDLTMNLYAKRSVQIRSNSLEASRIVATALLEKKLGANFFFKILLYPHQIIREKPIATGAGADRYSKGMGERPFGKPAGLAVQVKAGQKILYLKINKENFELGKAALKRFSGKIPTPVKLEIIQ